MAKSHTSAAVKNRYASKAYDRLNIVIPKGRKADVNAYAKGNGTTINALVSTFLQGELGLSDDEWKKTEDAPVEE